MGGSRIWEIDVCDSKGQSLKSKKKSKESENIVLKVYILKNPIFKNALLK